MIRNLLVVGGHSSAARAFRRHAATRTDLKLTTLVRRESPALAGEKIVVVGDYFDPPAEVLQTPDAILNFAGIPGGQDIPLLRSVNVDGPARLAASAKRNGVRLFVHLSSLHVYGHAENIDTTTPEDPRTPYGRSKLDGDRALLELRSDAFHLAILRLPILYGPGTGQSLRMLARLLTSLPVFPVRRRPVRRTILHIDNLAVVLEEVLRREMPGILFAADREDFTIDLFARVMKDVRGKAPRLLPVPDVFLLPLRAALGALYFRLYCSNLVKREALALPDLPLPVSAQAGLRDVIVQTEPTS